MPYIIVADSNVFIQRNFVADFLQAKCDFNWKTSVLRFEPPPFGVGATYDVHLRPIIKRVVDFLLMLVDYTAEALRANID